MAAPDNLTPNGALDRLFRTRFDRKAGPFAVAVSGGGDSLALLLAAQAFSASASLPFRAATVNHGLRPEAAEEARYVADVCAGHGIPHDTLTLTLANGSGLQARARTARYDALRVWAQGHGIGPVLMGHTQDDVTESIVMRLRRGVGLEGLAEMSDWWMDDQMQSWGRPFLDISRVRLREYLAENSVTPIEDPSNEDTRFERVEIRQALATLGWTDGALARSARHLASAAQSYDARLEALFDTCFRDEGGDLILEAAAAQRLGKDEADSLRRLVLAALGWIGRRSTPREAEQHRLMAFLRAPDSMGMTLAGCRIARKGEIWRFFRELSACEEPVPFGHVWDGRWRIMGPDKPNLTIGPLAEDIGQTPWRDGRLPYDSALTAPAVRQNGMLIAAPTVGLPGGYRAVLCGAPHAAFRRRRRFYN